MARKRISESPVVVSTGSAAVPARRKSTTSNRVSRTTADISNITEAAPEVTPAPASSTASNSEAIALLAYSFWESRGYQGGSPEEDWLRAEQQLAATPAK